MKIELSEKERLLLVELLEEKLSTIPFSEASMRLDYGYIQCKLELILKEQGDFRCMRLNMLNNYEKFMEGKSNEN